MPYTEVTVSSYNATPPTDDGSTATANQITWAGIKTKLGDPLNTAIPTLDDNAAAACNAIDADITAAETSISGLNTDLSGESGVLTAPSGTEIFLVQTAAPTGWTKGTTHDNKALRLVSGTVSTGGSTSFTSVLGSRTIATANLPSHTHTIAESLGEAIAFTRSSWTTARNRNTSSMTSGGNSRYKDINNSTAATSGTITHSGTSGSSGSGSAMDFAVQYVDIILVVKD